MRTKIFLLLTAWLSLLLSVSAEVVTGTDGEKITWSLDRETGVLTINGTGATTNDRPWREYKSEVKEIIVGEGITELSSSAFNGMSMAQTIKLPTTLTVIGLSAFRDCTGFTSITIPNSVKGLGYACFSGCSGLTSITIPSSVTELNSSCFEYCTNLEHIEVESANTVYDSRENCNAIVETSTNTMVAGCKNTKIPNSVTCLGAACFRGCTNLNSITIPSSVTNIGEYCFSGCTSLKTVNIPNGVTSLTCTFADCSSLENVEIPESVTSLEGVFRGCTSLESVVVPESVTNMQSSFSGCSSLKTVNIPAAVTQLYNAFSGCTSLESVVIPESVISLSSAFSGCTSLRTVNIPETVTYLSHAFDGCENLELTDVVLKNVTDISGAFRNCKHVKTVDMLYTYPYKSEQLASAFEGCDNIESVKVHLRLPWEISTLNMFSDAMLQKATLHVPYGCRSTYAEANVWKDFSKIVQDQEVTDVFIDDGQWGGINWSLSDEGVLKIEATSPEMENSGEMRYDPRYKYPWFEYRDWIVEVYVDNNVTKLGWQCFAGLSNMGKITIPFFGLNATPESNEERESSVAAIFESTEIKNHLCNFKLAQNLKEIVYTGSAINCKTAFENKIHTISSSYSDTYNAPSIDNITFTFKGLKEISSYSDFPKELISLPVNLDYMGESIPAGALAYLTGLRSLKLKGTGAPNGSTTFALNSLFVKYQQAGTTLVDGYYIPSNLEEVVIKEGTATIPNAAFKNLAMIKKITLPSTVVGVGEEAFYGCSGLTDLYVNSAFPPAAYSNCFTGVSKYNCKLHVPIDSKEYYKGDDYWKYFYFIETDANVTITVKKNIDNAGVVAGITKYNNGEEARLTAVPNGGYSFLMWQNERGETLSTSNELVLRATCDSTIYAIFKPMLNAGDVTATPTENTVSLTWTQQEGATTYTVSIYADATMTDLVKTITFDANGNVLSIQKVGYAAPSDNTMSATIQDLKAEMHYFYSIYAYNQEGVLISQQTGDFNTLEDTGIQYLSLPDGNASLSFGKNMITVSGADASICVYSAFGQLVATHAKADVVTFELPAGTYVVRSGSKTWKVLVK